MSISTYSFHEILPSQTSATTDEKLITMWLHGKSQTSQKTYTSTVKQFLAFVGKGLRELKLEDVQLWSSSLEVRYSATTVKNKVNAVKSLLSFGQKIGYLRFNVGSAVTTPIAKDTLSSRILTHEDVVKLIEATSCQRDRIMLSVAYKCGLRRAELCGLTWSDLQPRGDGGQATVFGKGGKTRTVLIPRKLWDELMRLPRSGKTDAVFVSRNGVVSSPLAFITSSKRHQEKLALARRLALIGSGTRTRQKPLSVAVTFISYNSPWGIAHLLLLQSISTPDQTREVVYFSKIRRLFRVVLGDSL